MQAAAGRRPPASGERRAAGLAGGCVPSQKATGLYYWRTAAGSKARPAPGQLDHSLFPFPSRPAGPAPTRHACALTVNSAAPINHRLARTMFTLGSSTQQVTTVHCRLQRACMGLPSSSSLRWSPAAAPPGMKDSWPAGSRPAGRN
jgi:hypothetical protein